MLQLARGQLFRLERGEERALQALEQILDSEEIQFEEAVEDGSVRPALHQRSAERTAERRFLRQADGQHGAGSIRHLRWGDAQAVLAQETGELLDPGFHRRGR
ncbi:MAG: hypothetical protein E6J85_18145 [Deltaproteobacteria bacterium]|nr:MAG: hypothetical protein E6J85_18145 [Deltaproteobacteria bacterium]